MGKLTLAKHKKNETIQLNESYPQAPWMPPTFSRGWHGRGCKNDNHARRGNMILQQHFSNKK